MALGFSRSLLRALFVVSVAGAALVGTQGCIITTSDNTPAPVRTGQLVLNWDIQGSKTASACSARGVANIHFRVYNSVGQQVGTTYEMVCSTFATSLALNPDTYTVQAELTDAAGTARTTTVGVSPLVSFIIRSDLDTPVLVTFPDTSFK